ncbi:hypothetical protein M422DRAFT_168160, partial [Sphaerobolus stellatus SS14]
QLIPPLSFTVVETFRQSTLQLFNPTNSTAPFFQIFDDDFLALLGPTPFVKQIASRPGFSFAFEAPIFVPETNDMFFASSVQAADATLERNNFIGKISITELERDLAAGVQNVNISLNLSDTVQITNGGTGPFKGNLLLATRGRGNLPASLVAVNPKPPFNTTVLLNSFFGRQFDSFNDIKIHPSGKIFVTDSNLGFISGQKTPLTLPQQVYMFDPETSDVRVVADTFVSLNGIALGVDGKIGYIGDAGVFGATVQQNSTATIYAYDIDPQTFEWNNRRVFAYIDAGIPDGIQVDTNGNVYAATADGVQVFRKDGTLIGKIFIGSNVANMAFAGDANLLIILANTEIFAATIHAISNLVVT